MTAHAPDWLADTLAAHERRLTTPCPCHGPDAEAPPWERHRGPLPDLARSHGVSAELLDCGWRPEWVDHDYRLPADDEHPERWVAEPYSLLDDAFADLAFLDRAGWRVTVTASNARHFPGHTVAVVIEPEGATP